jgi:glutamate--cysteine ligase catalytic subunit
VRLDPLRFDEIAPTVTNFPLFGVGDFVDWTTMRDDADDAEDASALSAALADDPATRPRGPAAFSAGVPDALINPHPRFAALTANIRKRRGSNVAIRVPAFREPAPLGTTMQSMDAADDGAEDAAAAPMIEMDAMAYGMGCCCLQLTFQARDVDESRFVYDQLAVLAPVMLALSAATPYFAGALADTDVRRHGRTIYRPHATVPSM